MKRLFTVKSEREKYEDVDRAKLHVMLVEDDDEDRIAIKRILSHTFEVVDFARDFDAILHVRRNYIDIALLSDNYLANISVARLLIALRENSKVFFRAFALTRYVSESQRGYLIAAGFEDTICKPIDYLRVNDLIYFRRMQS